VSLTGVWASHLEGTWAEYAEPASAEQQGIVKDAASMTHHLTGGPISRSGTGKYSVKKFPDSHRRPDESPQKKSNRLSLDTRTFHPSKQNISSECRRYIFELSRWQTNQQSQERILLGGGNKLHSVASEALVTTTIRLRFDRATTDHSTTYVTTVGPHVVRCCTAA